MSEYYTIAHLDRLDDQLAHEYGDQAPLVKAAIHWCITGETEEDLDTDGAGHEHDDLCDLLARLADNGLTYLADKIEAQIPRHILMRAWGRLSNSSCLSVIDILLGNHGTDTVTYGDQWDSDSPRFTYSNNGDSYATTIGYDSDGDWCVCGWADWIEEMEASEE